MEWAVANWLVSVVEEIFRMLGSPIPLPRLSYLAVNHGVCETASHNVRA